MQVHKCKHKWLANKFPLYKSKNTFSKSSLDNYNKPFYVDFLHFLIEYTNISDQWKTIIIFAIKFHVFEMNLLFSPRLHLFEKKNNIKKQKNNIMK